tara:strand:- start:17506 stop:19311 length:1806 start_codon:yes stop_codon:yes gene_type:complete
MQIKRLVLKLLDLYPAKYRKKLIWLILFLIISSSLEVLGISSFYFFLNYAIDDELSNQISFLGLTFLTENYSKTLAFFSIFILLIIISRIFMQFFIICFNFKLVKELNYYFSSTIYLLYINKPYKEIMNIESNKILLNIWGHPNEMITKGYIGLIQIVSTIMFSLVVLLTILFIEFKTTLIFILVTLMNVSLYFLFVSKRIHTWNTNFIFHHKRIIKNIIEMVKGFKVIKVFSKVYFFRKVFFEDIVKTLELNKKIYTLNHFPRFFLELNFICIIFFYIFYKTINGSNFIDLIPFLGLLAISASRLLPLVNQLTTAIQELKNSIPSFLSIESDFKDIGKEFKKLGDHSSETDILSEISFKNKILIKDLIYRHNNESNSLLIDEMIIEKSKIHCVIGKSGAGKTTAINLVMGLLNPEKGKFKIDNKLINTKKQNFMSLFSYIPQDHFVLNGTLRENIALSREVNKKIDEEIWEILKILDLEELINSKKQKLNFIVNEDGKNLSGGQIQKIMIARALFNKRKIFIFDEPTSFLDNKSKNDFFKLLNKLVKIDITIIMISHDIDVLKKSEKLFFFEAGKLLMQGKTSSLKKNIKIKEFFVKNYD